jgi:hypothetical protein
MPKFVKPKTEEPVAAAHISAGQTVRYHYHAEKPATVATFASSAPATAVVHSALFDGPRSIYTVDVTGRLPGTARITATRKDGAVTTLPVTVAPPPPRMHLAPVNTDAGLVERLLLAEARAPSHPRYDAALVKKCMGWMVLVLHHRLAHPGRFGSRTKDLKGIVSASGQFAGFGGYPALSADVAAQIANILKKANDVNEPLQSKYREHVQLAIDAATATKLVADPSPNGLNGWRTANASAPGGDSVAFSTPLQGNQFYQWKTKH